MSSVDYGRILRRSWELTWNNKWLWVVGMVLAAFGGGGGNTGTGGGSGTSSSNLREIPANLPGQLPEKAEEVLGMATSAVGEWFVSVPVLTWVLLGAGVVLLVVLVTAISMVARSWAKGALVGGMDLADSGKEASLKTMTGFGFSNIKSLIIFSVISGAVVLGVVAGYGVVFGVGMLVFGWFETLRTVWLVLTVTVGVLALVLLMLINAMIGMYAERLIVLKGMAPWEAWKRGLALSKGNFLPTLLMGLLNNAVGCSAGCLSMMAMLVIFGVPAVIVALPIINSGFSGPGWISVGGLVALFILFLNANVMLRGVMVVFSYGNWNLFFKQIVDKTEVKQ